MGGMVVDGKKYPWEGHSFVFTLKHPTSKELTATWVIPESSKAVSGLIRKLPHYGKFGYMVFEGEKSQNRAKGTWPANRNRLTKIFQAGLYPLPTPPPLVNYQPQLPTQ